ncbi:MAG TPA: outer membrane lipoprotein carrier protein LolA [Candidatus Binatia bacterium]|nr:outer membrane lipoprotein carrier protein LolA [Candidatus Binatia bacterium]
MKRKALAVCLSLMVWPLLGAAPVAEIQAILAKPKVLCGRFDQTKQLAGLKNPLRSNGRFCVVAGKGVLWRSLQPFANTLRLTRDEIVQWQGERLAMRLNAKQEPTVRLINSLLFSVLAGDLGQLEKYFDVEGVAGDGVWSVKLKARDAGVAKVIGAIALDGGAYVKNIAIDEANGDRTRIAFSALQTGEQAMTSEEAALF